MAKTLLRLLSALGVVLLALAYLLSWRTFTGLFREEIAARLGQELGATIDFDSVRLNLLRLRLQAEGARRARFHQQFVAKSVERGKAAAAGLLTKTPCRAR